MIKKIALGLFLIMFTLKLTAQEINWVTFNEATALQKKNPKKIMMDVYTVWCGPCKMLDRITFKNKDLVDYVNKYYYAVKFNGEGDESITYKDKVFTNPNYDVTKANRRNSSHEFARFLQVSAYPTIAFFDEDLKMISPIRGYQDPQQLELYLKLFKDDKYKEMNSQEAFTKYYEAFVPSFNTGKSGEKETKEVVVATPPKEKTVVAARTTKEEPTTVKRTSKEKELSSVVKFKTYTVLEGDWLSKIALMFYNDLNKYTIIFEANRDVLDSVDSIYAGQILKIPELD